MKTKTKIPVVYNLVIRRQKESKTMAKYRCNTSVIHTVLFICSDCQLQLLSFTANNKLDSKTNFFYINSQVCCWRGWHLIFQNFRCIHVAGANCWISPLPHSSFKNCGYDTECLRNYYMKKLVTVTFIEGGKNPNKTDWANAGAWMIASD